MLQNRESRSSNKGNLGSRKTYLGPSVYRLNRNLIGSRKIRGHWWRDCYRCCPRVRFHPKNAKEEIALIEYQMKSSQMARNGAYNQMYAYQVLHK